MEGGGVEQTIVAKRFVNAWPEEKCRTTEPH
jgi:hypothetical protein